MYVIVERRGLSAVFPDPFKGDSKEVLAVAHKGTIYSGSGKALDKGEIAEFCTRLGIKPKTVKPSRVHHEFLDSVSKPLGIEVKAPKGKKSEKPGRGRRKAVEVKKTEKKEPTPEQRAEREVLGRLKSEYSFRTLKSGGRGKSSRTSLVFTLKDRKDKDAEAVYRGKGEFEMVTAREMGTRIMARNKWAAKVLTEAFQAHWAEVLPAFLEESKA